MEKFESSTLIFKYYLKWTFLKLVVDFASLPVEGSVAQPYTAI